MLKWQRQQQQAQAALAEAMQELAQQYQEANADAKLAQRWGRHLHSLKADTALLQHFMQTSNSNGVLPNKQMHDPRTIADRAQLPPQQTSAHSACDATATSGTSAG